MTREEAISLLSQVNHILVNSNSWLENTHEPLNIAFDMAIKALEQEPSEDAVSRKAVVEYIKASDADLGHDSENEFAVEDILNMPSVTPTQKWIPVSEKYEHHIDHTDCIWYGNDSGCPVTCSQYRDGWNDAMDYIFKNGDGYRPYRRKENG